MSRLDEIKERERKATKGEWKFIPGLWNVGYETGHSDGSIITEDDGWYIATMENAPEQAENADFIAHSKEDIPWLIERLEEAREIIADRSDKCACDECAKAERWLEKTK
jgi:hypothetical protein